MQTTKPIVEVEPDGIAADLKEYRHWVAHRDKQPFDPKTGKRASVTDSRTWATFAEAYDAYESGKWDGVGFVFSSGDPYCGIDFDHCRDPETGKIDPRILDYIDGFEDRHVELSVSGTGVHLITRAKIKGGTKKGGYEVYDQDRFFTMTGVKIDA